MPTVRAKLQCIEKKHAHQGGHGVYCQVVLIPVWTGEDGANATWSKATPNGRIELGITVPEAIDTFELGKFYYSDFSPAD
jgi:hypothetical protein